MKIFYFSAFFCGILSVNPVNADNARNEMPVPISSSIDSESKCRGHVQRAVRDICEESINAITPIAIRATYVALDVDAKLYTIFIHFNKSAFSDTAIPFSAGWVGKELQASQSTNHIFAVRFISGLVKAGLDPSHQAQNKFILVCSKEDGLESVTGKAVSALLGCVRYDPRKDAIDEDYNATGF